MRISFRGFSGLLFSMQSNVSHAFNCNTIVREIVTSYDIELRLDSGEKVMFYEIKPSEIKVEQL